MKAWQVVRHGPPSRALELRDVPLPTPEAGQVRIRVRTSVCNLNEVDGCHGRYRTIDPPLPYTLGMELLGVVDTAGRGADAWLGKRVTACSTGAFGAHAEWAVADAAMTFEVPDPLDDFMGCAFFFPFHVSWLALFERGRLSAGEWLLVHSGAGGVGSAAVQLGVAAGARVIATASSETKRAFCRELGALHTFDYSDELAARLLEATSGHGIDVACDLVGGAATRAILPAMACGGRLVMAGFSGGIEAEDEPGIEPRPIVFGNFSIGGVMLSYREAGPRLPGVNLLPRALGERVQADLISKLGAGAIRPIVGRMASWTELPAELERLAARSTLGRSVLDWSGAGVSPGR